MKSVAVLQARTNSSRLPGKVLLPIQNIPLVALAARRAANTGHEVIVATSREVSDDALVQVLQQHEIQLYRGSLDNTLERIVSSLEGFSDNTCVFRMTSDNVFPDGKLLDEMEAEFLERNLDYLCCNGEKSGLPYGMSVELTYLKHLRYALTSTSSKHDLEHVTPFIRRKYGDSYFQKYKDLKMGHYRCTVDCLDDYLAVQKVFSNVENPVQVSALDLIQSLNDVAYQPWQPIPAKKLVLGTAQLGLKYGIANNFGKPDQSVAERLIKSAIANGAACIDTAREYGDSEEVIGNALKFGWEGRALISTKLSSLNNCPAEASTAVVNAFVDASIYESCSNLRMQSLDVVMLHRASHLLDWNGDVWKRLIEHQNKGTLKMLGVSVQNPEELDMVLSCTDVSYVQMPFNVLDWRWDNLIPKIIALKKKRKLFVHVRSVLLQGLLPSKSKEKWLQANFDQPDTVIEWLSEQTQYNGKTSVTDFCLNYVKSFEWIDGLVIGMETLDQLSDNVKILCSPNFSKKEINSILSTRPMIDESSLNPSRWS